jgi:hypothetical protein
LFIFRTIIAENGVLSRKKLNTLSNFEYALGHRDIARIRNIFQGQVLNKLEKNPKGYSCSAFALSLRRYF